MILRDLQRDPTHGDSMKVCPVPAVRMLHLLAPDTLTAAMQRGQRPLDLAKAAGQESTVKLLELLGAEVLGNAQKWPSRKGSVGPSVNLRMKT